MTNRKLRRPRLMWGPDVLLEKVTIDEAFCRRLLVLLQAAVLASGGRLRLRLPLTVEAMQKAAQRLGGNLVLGMRVDAYSGELILELVPGAAPGPAPVAETAVSEPEPTA